VTTIKATCPSCGDVDLTPADVTVTVARELGWSTYTFRCRSCAEAVVKSADEETVRLLSGAGVRVERMAIPLEFLESRVLTRTNPPLTEDDVLDFGLWLARASDVVQAANAD
jgi:hypothetical protein